MTRKRHTEEQIIVVGGETGSVLDFALDLPIVHPMARPLRLEFPGALYHLTA